MAGLINPRGHQPATDTTTRAALLAGFIGGFDASAAFFIFPDVRDSLAGGDAASASWVLSITSIVGAALLLQAGRISDKYGPERTFRAGAAVFTGAAVASAAAPGLWWLVVFRALAAGGQAAMGPAGVALVLRSAEESARAHAIARWGLYTAVAGVLGPIVVTQLIDSFSWRALFALQFPIGVVVLVLIRNADATTDRDHAAVLRPLDSALTIAALILLVLPIVEADTWGWGSLRTASCLTGAVGLTGVLLARCRDERSSPIPLRFFRSRDYSLATLMSVSAGAAFFAHWLALLLFLTEVWGYDLIRSGLLLTLMPATMSLLAVPAGRLADRSGPKRVMIPGIAVYTAAFGAFWLAAGSEASIGLLLPTAACAGVGMACVWPTLTSVAASGVRPKEVGSASAVVHTIQRIGGALGIAVVLALVASGDDTAASDQYRRGLAVMPVAGLVTLGLALFVRR